MLSKENSTILKVLEMSDEMFAAHNHNAAW
jgi:hypothetical protein